MAHYVRIHEAVEMRWAARGILVRLPDNSRENNEQRDVLSLKDSLAAALPKLEERVSALPFDILPLGVDLSSQPIDNDNPRHHHPIPNKSLSTRDHRLHPIDIISNQAIAGMALTGAMGLKANYWHESLDNRRSKKKPIDGPLPICKYYKSM